MYVSTTILTAQIKHSGVKHHDSASGRYWMPRMLYHCQQNPVLVTHFGDTFQYKCVAVSLALLCNFLLFRGNVKLLSVLMVG